MTRTFTARLLELFFFFFVLPVLMSLEIVPRHPLAFLNILGLLAYFVLRKEGKIESFRGAGRAWRAFVPVFAVLAPLFTAFSYFWLGSGFLSFPRERTAFWIIVCMLYPLLSVVAQEVLYRVWFWERYSLIFPSPPAMIIVSAIVFGFGHVVMKNAVAVIWSTLGGFLFSYTYHRTRKLGPVWLEHSLWGILLFTLGWGRYLYHGAR